MRIKGVVRLTIAAALVPAILVHQSAAWGRDGHKMIDRLAAAALPADVPEFLRSPAALDAMEYYGPEPDDWKSSAEPELNSAGSPEHFIDLEWADLIGEPLPRNRYDYLRDLAAAQPKHPDIKMTPEGIGLLPYAANEGYERLKAAMRDYRALPPDSKDRKGLEAEIVFLAGILGHWVGDGSQPLHATIEYNGWTTENPNGYVNDHKIHARFESDFVKANVNPQKDIAPLIPAKAEVIGDVFDQFVGYLRHSNTLVEPLYKLDKTGAFTDAGTPEGKAFVDERIAAGATELRNLIYTAWVKSADPLPAYRPAPKPAPAP
jgi:hypothetical protein